eukprot:scaffold30220_cov135-Isochrysis_galbana.AAC.1
MAVSSTRAPSRVQLAIAPASDLHVEAGAADQSAREPIARVLNSSSSRAKILQTSSWRARALWIRLIANLEDAPLLPSDAWSACALGEPHANGGEILVPREVHEFRRGEPPQDELRHTEAHVHHDVRVAGVTALIRLLQVGASDGDSLQALVSRLRAHTLQERAVDGRSRLCRNLPSHIARVCGVPYLRDIVTALDPVPEIYNTGRRHVVTK